MGAGTSAVDTGLLLLLLLAAAPAAGRAQGAQRPLSVDVGVGLGHGGGGGARNARSGPAASALLAWHARKRPTGALVAGASASVQGPFPFDHDCIVPVGGGECLPDYPTFYSAALLGGWHAGQTGAGQGGRALLGPAMIWSSRERLGGRDRWATTVGLQGRLDYATPMLRHAALVLWANGTFVPRLQRATYIMGSVGIGVRLH